MRTLEISFWVILGVVFYAYIGYPILLRVLVFLKELIRPPKELKLPEQLPSVTLFITAYNQECLVDQKMQNSLELDYPKELLEIMWVTDGSTDDTNEMVSRYPEARLEYVPINKGKCGAMNRAIQLVESEITVFSDAKTMLNSEAINEIVKQFTRSKVGCVAGEKRVEITVDKNYDITVDGEGVYWRYESMMKNWASRLYSGIGASGEFYAIRTKLYRPLLIDTMHDNLSMTMKLAADGNITAYAPNAYATNSVPISSNEMQARAVKLAAGGLQAISRCRQVLNPMNHGILFFEYISQRVLRMTIVPIFIMMLFPLNVILVIANPTTLNIATLVIQVLFNLSAYIGYRLSRSGIKFRLFRLPYFFWFMKFNAFRGYAYLRQRRVSTMWKRTKRAYF